MVHYLLHAHGLIVTCMYDNRCTRPMQNAHRHYVGTPLSPLSGSATAYGTLESKERVVRVRRERRACESQFTGSSKVARSNFFAVSNSANACSPSTTNHLYMRLQLDVVNPDSPYGHLNIKQYSVVVLC